MLIIDAAPVEILIPSTMTSPGGGGTTLLAFATNGRGLLGNTPSLSSSHDPPDFSSSGNSWQSSLNPPLPLRLIFTFSEIYTISGLSYWAPTGTSSSQGLNQVLIEFSIDGNIYTSIPGSPTVFARGSSATTPQPPQRFSWNPIQAKNIRFSVSSNYGSSRCAVAEVQFKA